MKDRRARESAGLHLACLVAVDSDSAWDYTEDIYLFYVYSIGAGLQTNKLPSSIDQLPHVFATTKAPWRNKISPLTFSSLCSRPQLATVEQPWGD